VNDADVLRRAAEILRERSTKPDGLLLRAFCKLLEEQADLMEVAA